ncbi:hypothetical protein ITJ66_16775 [Plantibacter sp. VKM Ac-2885]|uniref:hypothetical protein n=1 Tax=Plantibacter sp. VKM Ac-2885 TaxID=2783828 RepID=UPI00188C1BBD|nr:hypothetical protein [Plantibacter sp. VKM Ac-2885]MBF4514142.1 hypothetical protein [Plantibacter sp. VKM Ac-2885]
MNSQERHNEVHVGGVHLSDVHSGDVSAVHEQLEQAIARGGGWVTIDAPDGIHYVVRITPTTDVVIRYT